MKPEKYFFLLLHCFNVSLISSDKAHHTSLEFEECEMAISTCQLLTSKAYYCESSCAFNSHFGNVFLEKPVVQFACGKWWLYIHGLLGFLHGITCTHLIFFLKSYHSYHKWEQQISVLGCHTAALTYTYWR